MKARVKSKQEIVEILKSHGFSPSIDFFGNYTGWKKNGLSGPSNDYINAVCDKEFDISSVHSDDMLDFFGEVYIGDRNIFRGWDHVHAVFCELPLKEGLDKVLEDED